MTVFLPVDILADFPGWSTNFSLQHRQEYSRTAGGVTIAKDMGTPLWRASYQSRVLLPNELDHWRARLSALDGSVQRFMGKPMSRCYPVAYPNGWRLGDVSSVTVASVGSDNKSVVLAGLPSGYITSIGDYIQIGTKLYQVVDVSSGIEIRPHLAPGTVFGNAVVLVKPAVPMIMVPESLSSLGDAATGRGSISFQAIESR